MRIKLRVSRQPSSQELQQQQQLLQQQQTSQAKNQKLLYPTLDQVVDQLEKKDAYGLFIPDVDTSQVLDYLTVIKEPMSFSQMRRKIQSRQYENVQQLALDFELICQNSMKYNQPDTIYHKQARKLQQVGSGILKKFMNGTVMTLSDQKVIEEHEASVERQRLEQEAIEAKKRKAEEQVELKGRMSLRDRPLKNNYYYEKKFKAQRQGLDDGSAIVSDDQYYKTLLLKNNVNMKLPEDSHIYTTYGPFSSLHLEPNRGVSGPEYRLPKQYADHFAAHCQLLYGDPVSMYYLESLRQWDCDYADLMEAEYTRNYHLYARHVHQQFDAQQNQSSQQCHLESSSNETSSKEVTSSGDHSAAHRLFKKSKQMHQLRYVDEQLVKQFGENATSMRAAIDADVTQSLAGRIDASNDTPILQDIQLDQLLPQSISQDAQSYKSYGSDRLSHLLTSSHDVISQFSERLDKNAETNVAPQDANSLTRLQQHLRSLLAMTSYP